jgi:RNA polymerase sigma factor (sigma-70 family)
MSPIPLFGSNEELWKKFLEGDRDSFSLIYRTYYRDLYTYGQRILRHPDDTKNLIHELFLHLWENRSQLSPVDSVKSYLLVAMRRRVFRSLELKRKFLLKPIDGENEYDGFVFFLNDFDMPEDQDQIKNEQLLQAINSLTQRQREIVYLRYYQDLSITEIADALSLNYQSVSNHLQRAFQAIRTNPILRILVTLSSIAGILGLSLPLLP